MKHFSLEEWHELGRAFYDVQLKTDPKHFAAGAGFMAAGRTMLTRVQFTPMVLAREPRKIRRFDNAFLLFERYQRGRGEGMLGETASKVDLDTLHVLNLSERYITSTSHDVGDACSFPTILSVSIRLAILTTSRSLARRFGRACWKPHSTLSKTRLATEMLKKRPS